MEMAVKVAMHNKKEQNDMRQAETLRASEIVKHRKDEDTRKAEFTAKMANKQQELADKMNMAKTKEVAKKGTVFVSRLYSALEDVSVICGAVWVLARMGDAIACLSGGRIPHTVAITNHVKPLKVNCSM